MSRVERYNFEEQLAWLREQLSDPVADSPAAYRMLLSLADSVKAARDHELNCLAAKPFQLRP